LSIIDVSNKQDVGSNLTTFLTDTQDLHLADTQDHLTAEARVLASQDHLLLKDVVVVGLLLLLLLLLGVG
jgi:hypothetical protein